MGAGLWLRTYSSSSSPIDLKTLVEAEEAEVRTWH